MPLVIVVFFLAIQISLKNEREWLNNKLELEIVNFRQVTDVTKGSRIRTLCESTNLGVSFTLWQRASNCR